MRSIREGLKKNGGLATGDFPLKKQRQKNMGIKHWGLPNNQLKTHLFYFPYFILSAMRAESSSKENCFF